MKNKHRTFLLGAGFSKAVADGPLMKEIWEHIEKACSLETQKPSLSGGNNRLIWFRDIKNFIENLENIAKEGFPDEEIESIGYKEDMEFIFTLIDLCLSAPQIYFKQTKGDTSPYPAIPLPNISHFKLQQIRRNLETYLYVIFEKLEGNSLSCQFADILDSEDEIITFNYDLVIEKTLWDRNHLWSPLNGYVGIENFLEERDQENLASAGLNSKIKIHKMHGSLCWDVIPGGGINDSQEYIAIALDNREHWDFHFSGLEPILKREPIKPSGQLARQISTGYGGSYGDLPWILPSFVKPFDKKELYYVWQSAFHVMANTDELIIIGYSFRPEDSNAVLLMSALPKDCKVQVVDVNPGPISEKLAKLGITVTDEYQSMDAFLESCKHKDFQAV